MGGEPWFYFFPYQADINSALQALRRREFQAGRYNPVTPFLLERGQGVYIVAYRDDKPSEIFFAGYSFD